MTRAAWVMCVLLVASSVLGVDYRRQLAKITRWQPSFATLHKMSLWYSPVERAKPLPAAKKVFNFARGEHSSVLAELAVSAPRGALNGVLNADVRAFSTYMTERIAQFADFSCDKKICADRTFCLGD